MLGVEDEFTREALAIKVDRELSSTEVLETLAELMLEPGVPEHIRFYNGPEIVAQAVRDWIKAVGSKISYIEPDSPWENRYVESLNARLRDELLNPGSEAHTARRSWTNSKQFTCHLASSGKLAAQSEHPQPRGPARPPRMVGSSRRDSAARRPE